MRITSRDIETLNELCAVSNYGGKVYVRPLDIGGHSRSHHSGTLHKLSRLGYVEMRQRRASGKRGSKEYRITTDGRELLYQESKA